MSTQKLVSRSDPFLSTNTLPREENFSVDLDMLGYVFAVQSIDEKAGTIEVWHTRWGQGQKKVAKQIETVDCIELLQSRDRSTFSKPWLLLLDSITRERKG